MPPIDGPLTTPGGSVWALMAVTAHANTPAAISVLFMAPERVSCAPHEPDDSPEADSDDGARVLHLGRLVSVDLRLPAERRLHAGGTDVDSQHLPRRRDHRHVLQQPVRRPEFRGGALPVGQPPDRRRRDDRALLDARVLAVLLLHAGALPALRADDLHHELDRVRADEGA